MKYNTLGGSDLNVSELCLGTMTFGWAQASETVDEQVATEFVSAFSGAGHKTIDCARICKLRWHA